MGAEMCRHCAPGAILSTRSMTPWPTVPLPPMLVRPAALMTSCSLSATLICANAFLSPNRPKDPFPHWRDCGCAQALACTGAVRSEAQAQTQSVELSLPHSNVAVDGSGVALMRALACSSKPADRARVWLAAAFWVLAELSSAPGCISGSSTQHTAAWASLLEAPSSTCAIGCTVVASPQVTLDSLCELTMQHEAHFGPQI